MTDEKRKADVLRLRYVDCLSTRQIALRLSMSRRTVRDLLGQRKPKLKPAIQTRESILAPYEAKIRSELAKTPELRAPAMLERLRLVGYTGGISVLRDRLRALRDRPHVEVFSTFTTRPGERLEVDWADLGFAIAEFRGAFPLSLPCSSIHE